MSPSPCPRAGTGALACFKGPVRPRSGCLEGSTALLGPQRRAVGESHPVPAERVRRAASGRGVGLRRDRLDAHPASVADGHVHMAYARLVADLVEHELDARREAVHLEPV
jgi:hypothetical protein